MSEKYIEGETVCRRGVIAGIREVLQQRSTRIVLLLGAASLCVWLAANALLLLVVAPRPKTDVYDRRSSQTTPKDFVQVTKSSRKTKNVSRNICKYINCSVFARTPKTILLWNAPPLEDNLGYGSSEKGNIFQNLSCRPNDCFMTQNVSFLPPTVYDAVVFNNSRPSSVTYPRRRRREQRYIFFLREPPPERFNRQKIWDSNNIYNWTMTYRLDSDVYFPRAEVRLRSGEEAPRGRWLYPKEPPPSLEIASEPPARNDGGRLVTIVKVAWFNPDCMTDDDREIFVTELRRFARVDLFGKCARLVWPQGADPETELANRYDFYLVMESSSCRDYVAEKLFNILKLDVVPLVYGTANYSAVVPSYSYIDARAFPTISLLATYLQYVVGHPDEYSKFFWWKDYYEVHFNPSSNLCRLCEKLHESERAKVYRNILRWWHEQDECTKVERQLEVTFAGFATTPEFEDINADFENY